MNINLNTNISAMSPQRTEYGRQEFAEPRQGTTINSATHEKVTITPEFLTGDDNVLSLGRFILGGEEMLNDWSDRGLEVTEESIRNAFDTFNQAMKKHFNTKDSSGLAINHYQIVANNQDVPSWFIEEKEQNISAIDDPITKAAFKSGDLYHIRIDNGANIRQIRNYQSIANF